MNQFEIGSEKRFRLASISGIPIYVTLWFLILLGFVVIQAIIERDLASLIGLLTLFAIIILHELGHALAARTFGNRVLGITLHLFGGLMEHTGRVTRAQGILISLAGPAVNLILLVPAALLRFSNLELGYLGATFVLALFVLNIVLLLFNLLPIYPLDGGQVTRSLLEKYFGPVRAVVLASIISLVFLAGASIVAILSRWEMLAVLLLGTLIVTNVVELGRGAKMLRALGVPPLRPWKRFRVWLRRKLIRRKLQQRDFSRLLNQALQHGIEKLDPEERRALIWHKAQLELRIRQHGLESLTEEEQELFWRHSQVLQGGKMH